MKRIDPQKYHLTPRTTLYKKMDNIFIIIDRKSRIIMKDGYRISEQAKSILSVEILGKENFSKSRRTNKLSLYWNTKIMIRIQV